MKVLIVLMLLLCSIWAEKINSKIILSSHIKSKEAAKSLYDLETFFHENKEAKMLKNDYDFKLSMELLDKYILITISPIQRYSVENRLLYLLKEKFPNSFVVDDNKIIETQLVKEQTTNSINSNIIQKQTTLSESKRDTLLRTINFEWIALILLALVGFVLAYRSAKQIIKIRELQKEIAKYHIILEDEVDTMRARHG